MRVLDKIVLYENLLVGLLAVIFTFLTLGFLIYAVALRIIAVLEFVLLMLMVLYLLKYSARYLYMLGFMLKGKVILTDYYDPHLLQRRGCNLVEKRMRIAGDRYYVAECHPYGYELRMIVYPTRLRYLHTTKPTVLHVVLEGNEELFKALKTS
jgi:hypothetical protein